MAATAYQIHCPACNDRQRLGPTEMLDRLRKVGKLRRAANPSAPEVLQLFQAAAPHLACGACGAIGLNLAPDRPSDGEDWPEARLCAGCQRPIPAERLEALPKAVLCAPCQARQERGETDDTPDYCPRCGSIRTLRAVRAGIVRYAFYCPGCRK